MSTHITVQEHTRYQPATLIVFRFAFIIVVVTAFRVCIVIPIHLVFDVLKQPVSSGFNRGDTWVWERTTAIGAFVLHWVAGGPPVQELIAGFHADRTSSAIPDLIGLVTIAIVIAIVWSILDHPRPNYEILNRCMRAYLRWALGGVMLHYAFIKVIPTQFGFLTPGEMLQPFGYLTPMRVLWDFMAASSGYTIFAGLVELLGATLLFFRRTTLLGCLILCGALINVVVMDLAYDVGAVTYADTLLIYDVVLLAPYLQPLLRILLGKRDAILPAEPPPVRRRWYHSPLAKAVAVCAFVFPLVQINLERRQSFFGNGQPVYGLFEVTRFERNGNAITPLASDDATWKRLASDRFNSICIQFANADVRRFQFKDDSLRRVWTINDANPAHTATLQYSVQQDATVSLNGRIGSDPVTILLRRVDIKQFFPLLRHAERIR